MDLQVKHILIVPIVGAFLIDVFAMPIIIISINLFNDNLLLITRLSGVLRQKWYYSKACLGQKMD